MLCSMAQLVCDNFIFVMLSMQPMKSSTKTLIKAVVLLMSHRGTFLKSCSDTYCSNRWGGRFVFRREDIMSRAVSDASQKNGGDLHHHICKLLGTTTWMSPMVLAGSEVGYSNRNSSFPCC